MDLPRKSKNPKRVIIPRAAYFSSRGSGCFKLSHARSDQPEVTMGGGVVLGTCSRYGYVYPLLRILLLSAFCSQ